MMEEWNLKLAKPLEENITSSSSSQLPVTNFSPVLGKVFLKYLGVLNIFIS